MKNKQNTPDLNENLSQENNEIVVSQSSVEKTETKKSDGGTKVK